MSVPKFAAVPMALFAVGLGMAMYYGDAWRKLPTYTADDISASAALNLAADLHRRPADAPKLEKAQVEALRRQIADEVSVEIDKERRDVQLPFFAGLLTMLFAVGQMWLLKRLRRK